ncbi:MAG TPA: hypothetical protein VGJ92_04845 [Methanocella sp.]
MPEPSAGLAAKNAWLRTRRLLFPFRPGRWLSIYMAQLIRYNSADPAAVELRRIRPYYRGTRLLTAAGLGLVLLAFILPFSVLFVSIESFSLILVAYAVTFLFASLLGMAVQSAMDAVFALQYERRLAFGEAIRAFRSLMRSRGDLTLGYMAIKMTVDFLLSTLALLFFLPALVMAMYLMIYVMNGVNDGIDLGSTPYIGLVLVALLAFLGFVATLLLALPATAFYGYYTEEAVKMMQEAYPEALHQEKEG